MYVLNNYCPHQHLIGIFTTQEKAKIAAEEYMKFISNAPFEIEEVVGEILYGNGETVIHITEWAVDKALVGGEWKIIGGDGPICQE